MRAYQKRTIRRPLCESLGTATEKVNTNIIPIINVGHSWIEDLLDMEYEDISETDYDGGDIPSEEWNNRRSQILNFIAKTAEKFIQSGFDYLWIKAKVVPNSAKFFLPRFYNYSDSELDFTISYDLDWFNGVVKYLATNERFVSYLKSANSSRDGFISSLPSTVGEFIKCANSDNNRWKALSCVCSYYIYINRYEIEDLQRDFEDVCYENR